MTPRNRIASLAIAFSLAAVLAIAQTQTQKNDAPKAKKESASEWICRVLHFDPKVYAKLVGVRQGQEQIGGDHIALADLNAKTEVQIEDCGECWSPAVIDSKTIAFLKADGVWIRPIQARTSHLAVSAAGLRILAGPAAGVSSQLIVLQHRSGVAGCEYRLAAANLSTGQLDVKPDAPQCLGEADISAIPRAGALRGSRVLYNSPSGQGFRKILVGELPSETDYAGAARISLLPWIDANADGIDRFDAVWLDATRVIYVQRQ